MSIAHRWAVSLLLLSAFVLLPTDSAPTVVAQENSTELHPREVFVVDSSIRSVPDAFQHAELPYYPEDRVTAFPDPSLGLGSVITVDRALPVQIRDGKRLYTVRTWQTTLRNLLAEKKIELGEEDRISLPLDTPLDEQISVTITRVARTFVSEFETISFSVKERENSSMWRGEKRVIQEGKSGEREKKYLLIREDGELISKTLVSDSVVEKAVDKIIEVGTKLKIGSTFSGTATWYSASTKVAIAIRTGLKRGQEVRITNLSNGKSIIVKIDDMCACNVGSNAIVDLSPTYFSQLGATTGQGIIQNVRVEQILP